VNVIEAVREQHCPDRRLCVYDISVDMRGANLKLVGEMTSLTAKSELVQAVKAVVPDFKVEEEIRLLPDEALGQQRFAIVRVGVANLRKKPAHASELVHQQLMGGVFSLLQQSGDWYRVQTEDRYLAWVPIGSIVIGDSAWMTAWQNSELVACDEMNAAVRIEPHDQALPLAVLTLGGIVRSTQEVHDANAQSKKKWLQIELPDGRTGFVEKEMVAERAEVFPNTPALAQRVVETAKKFLGVPYLWGGTSTEGFDCSGFTQTVFRLNGMQILRDASQQARMGESIVAGKNFDNLQPGDLLLFGEKEGKITHVAISLGGARFIHASDWVQINSLDPNAADYAEDRHQTFQFAKRFFPATPPVSKYGKF
jgi:cell wall-associated NlpC family hydrolase